MKTILDIGCGKCKTREAIGIDVSKECDINILYDCNLPLPIKDNTVDKIILSHVIEHLDEPIKMIEEAHRVLKDGGILVVGVPHVSSYAAFTDPTHKKYFAIRYMDYFTQSHHLNYISHARFKIIKKQFRFKESFRFLDRLFNVRPDFFEEFLRYIPVYVGIHWEMVKQ
jgi:predicted SAM-dependent methyltransferase